jgi:hypothetical protein
LEVGEHDVRDEWAAFDLKTASCVKIEVKSAAYIQSWQQRDYSKIQFSIRKTQAWDAETGVYITKARRHADVYVFALLRHKDQDTVDPLDVSQWAFYVLSTGALDARTGSQRSIALGSLEKLAGKPHGFRSLATAVERAARRSVGR